MRLLERCGQALGDGTDLATKRLRNHVEVAAHSQFGLTDQFANLLTKAGGRGTDLSAEVRGKPVELRAQLVEVRAQSVDCLARLWVHGPSLAALTGLVNAVARLLMRNQDCR